MIEMCRHRLTVALLISLLLHLTFFSVPGWHVPTLEDLLQTDGQQSLEARLAPVRSRASTLQQVAARSVTPRTAPVLSAPRGVVAMPSEVTPVVAPLLENSGPSSPIDPLMSEDGSLSGTPATLEHPAEAPIETALPRRGSIRFILTRSDQGFVVGQSLHRWSHDGTRYTMSNVSETTGIAALFKPVRVKWVSEGEIAQGGLRPHVFRTEKDGIAGDTASFDWPSMRLTLSGGAQREAALVQRSQDMFSMFYQFSATFPALPYGRSEINVTTGRKIERYSFDNLGEEKQPVGKGELRTLHLRTNAGDQMIDIWLALELRGLPVKIRYTDGKGESFEQIADDIEFEGMTGSAGGH